MANGFVYRWTNSVNGKWYVGSHKGTADDGYRHSSKPLAYAEKKYGIENFTREILKVCDNYKEVEAQILREFNAANNPQSYNRTNITGPNAFSEESKIKTSRTMTGMIRGPQTPEHIAKKSAAQKGLKRRPETCERIRKTKQGEKNPMYGKVPTEEHRRKVSEGLKQAYANGTRVSAQKGKPSWNKGITPETLICPHCSKEGRGPVMYRHHFAKCSKIS